MEQGFQELREVEGLASLSEGDGTCEDTEGFGDVAGSYQLTLILLMIC